MRRQRPRWMTLTMFLGIFFVHLTGGPMQSQPASTSRTNGKHGPSISPRSGTDLGNLASGLKPPCMLRQSLRETLLSSNSRAVSTSILRTGTLLLTISTPFEQPGYSRHRLRDHTRQPITSAGKSMLILPPVKAWGLFSNPGLGRADFMTLDSNGNLYVTDFGFHATGSFEKISSTGVDEGHFLTNVGGIEGIAFDSHGNLYAAFDSRFRITGRK